MSQHQGDITAASSDGSAPGSALSISLNSPTDANVASASIVLGGTFVATLQFEGSADGGASWYAVDAFPPNSDTPATDATEPGLWQLAVAALTNLRVRCSAFTSGPVGVVINTSVAAFA
jgi:hypothetical protein